MIVKKITKLCLWVVLSAVVVVGAAGAETKIKRGPAQNVAQKAKQKVVETNEFLVDLRLYEPLVWSGESSKSRQEQSRLKDLFARNQNKDDVYLALADFLQNNPNTGYALSIGLNLGRWHFDGGRFSEAIASYERAWVLGEALTKGKQVGYQTGIQTGIGFVNPEVKSQADRALGELMGMHARLGHDEALNGLLKANEGRSMSGGAAHFMSWGKYASMMFKDEPGLSYLCGPMAMKSILERELKDQGLEQGQAQTQNAKQAEIESDIELVSKYRSSREGVKLSELAELTQGLKSRWQAYQYQEKDAALDSERLLPVLPVPSVVHWRVNHYAAILGYRDGKYEVKDPTFGIETMWMKAEDVVKEMSGYIMVPEDAKWESKEGWQSLGKEQMVALGGAVYGRGVVISEDDNPPPDGGSGGDGAGGGGCDKGMAVCQVDKHLIWQRFSDTPLWYGQAVGEAIEFRLFYSGGSKSFPAVMGYGNVGSQWSHSWQRYYQGGNPGGVFMNGGVATFSWNGSGFNNNITQVSKLYKTSKGYELRDADGSKKEFETGVCDRPTDATAKCFLSGQVDEQGNRTRFEYDAQNRLVRVIDAMGKTSTLVYGNANNSYLITEVKDPFGRSAKLSYDSQGRLVSITDMIGLVSVFEYKGTTDEVIGMSTPYGKYSYEREEWNFYDRRLTITDPKGSKEVFQRKWNYSTVCGNVIPEYYEDVNAIMRSYGVHSEATKSIHCRNTYHWNKEAYGQFGMSNTSKASIYHWLVDQNISIRPVINPILESFKKPLEMRTWYLYPEQKRSFNPGQLPIPSAVLRVAPDKQNVQATLVEYNELGNPTKITRANGSWVNMKYADNQIDVVEVEDQRGVVAKITWNDQHRITSYVDAAGKTTSFTYNAQGQKTSESLADGSRWTYEYQNGYLMRMRDPNGAVYRSYTYDTVGRVASESDGSGLSIKYAYDNLDRVVQETYGDGKARKYTYDKLDLVSETDEMGRTTRYTYDALRNLTQKTYPSGRVEKYEYNRDDHLVGLIDGEGKKTVWQRDIQGRVVKKVFGDGSWESYEYDGLGRQTLVKRSDGSQKELSYNLMDQVVRVEGKTAGQVQARVLSYVYDELGRLLQASVEQDGKNSFNAKRYGYVGLGKNGAGNVEKVYTQLKGLSGASAELETIDGKSWIRDEFNSYDALGRLIKRQFGGDTRSYEYDKLGRLTKEINGLGSTVYSYEGNTSRMTKESNGVLGAQYGYDAQRKWLNQLSYLKPSGVVNAVLPQYTYSRNGVGDVLSWQETVNGNVVNATAAYDADSRLTTLKRKGAQSYKSNQMTYDRGDNIAGYVSEAGTVANGVERATVKTSAAQSYDGVNSLTQGVDTTLIGAKTTRVYSRDARGNRVEDQFAKYEWNDANQLVKIVYKNNKLITQSEIGYDALGKPLWIRDGYVSGARNSRLIWCGLSVCQKRDATNNALQKSYARQGEWIGSTKSYYVRDQLGSIVGTTASGAVLNVKIERDAYGKEEALLGSTADAKYAPDVGYAGMYYHWASGFNLTPNRWYDSRTGRWLSRDPIAEAGGTNLYNYVGGNVLNYTDPSGLFAIPVGQCLVGAGAVIGGGPLGWVLGGAIIADAVVGSILNNASDSGGGDKAPPSNLPSDPTDLPSEWKRDDSHKDPNGERYKNDKGDTLDFHKGRPGLPGWRGKDHWHYNGGNEHIAPKK